MLRPSHEDKVISVAEALDCAFSQLTQRSPYTGALSALVQGLFLWHLEFTDISPTELSDWGGPFAKPMWAGRCPSPITNLYGELDLLGPDVNELGHALELLYWRGKSRTERDQGVYYTKPLLAKTMAGLAIDLYLRERMRSAVTGGGSQDRLQMPSSFVVLDPAVGAGAFLVAALEELFSLPDDIKPALTKRELLPFLAGYDIDTGAVYISKARLWLQVAAETHGSGCPFPDLSGIAVGNSLEDLLSPADVVLANPPYRRQESIAPELKMFLNQRFKGQIPKQADLYAYFLADLSYMLKPGGVAVVVTPTAWLEVDYGRSVQRLLSEELEIPLIIGSARERWFDDAAVHTVITTLLRRSDGRRPRRPTVLVNLMDRLQSVEHQELSALTEIPLGYSADSRWQTVNWPKKRFRALTDKTEAVRASWGTLLRAPAVYFQLHEQTEGRWTTAGRVGEVRRGFTSGANAFFYVRQRADASELESRCAVSHLDDLVPIVVSAAGGERHFELERKFLQPLIKSPREVSGYVVREDELRQLVILFPPDEDELKNTKATDYIRFGAEQGYSLRPTLRSRPRWWSLPKIPPPQVLVRQFYDQRFNFPYNPRGILCDHTFYYLTGCKDPELLAALLNSTVIAFHVELWGRTNMGDGVLTFYGPELGDLPLMKPELFDDRQQRAVKEAFRRLNERQVFPIQQEVHRKDRRELDLIVLEALGLSGLTGASILGEIYSALCQLVDLRRERSR